MLADASGGVKTVSYALFRGLIDQDVDVFIHNMSDRGGSRFMQYAHAFCSLCFSGLGDANAKGNEYIMMHLDAIVVGLFASMLRWSLARKIVNVYHIDLLWYYNGQHGFRRVLLRTLFWLLRRRKSVFVSYEAQSRASRRFGFKNSSVIYNIFEPDGAGNRSLTAEQKTRSRGPVLGVVSRLHRVKNIDLVVRLVDAARRRGADVSLEIFGAGPEHDRLRHYIHRLDCADFVHLRGYCDDKNEIYQSIDALVSMSLVEGWGMTILECIDHGKPVFHTDCYSGPREILFPHGDPSGKTQSFEMTRSGFLVKPVGHAATYLDRPADSEQAYVDYLLQFMEVLMSGGFQPGSDIDFDRFRSDRIVPQWLSLAGD